jgi:SAM-dependent MidA family methyltransferase
MPGMRPTTALPEPSSEALAASAELSGRIAARIAAAGGWMGFDAYMAMALYEPGLGYYAGGSRKFGAAGDFVTAPELSDLFGACLARQCAFWFEGCARRVVEFGAGSGALAAQLLRGFDQLGLSDVEYLIVELSGELAARQRARLARECPQALERVRWLDTWPQAIDGVVIANELLDALPVRAFAVEPASDGAAARVFERGVARRPTSGAHHAAGHAVGSATGDAPDHARDAVPGFDWALRPADARFARIILERLAEGSGIDDPRALAYAAEIGEQAQAWATQAARCLARGALLLIDYGFARPAYYHAQRSGGTLMCHYRHRAHGDPFLLPGLQDITAHVDFTAIAQAGVDEGLEVLGFVSQARMLLDLGLLDDLAAHAGRGDATAWARQAQAVQRLLSEAEMGELFKALALGRGLSAAGPGFAHGDRPLALRKEVARATNRADADRGAAAGGQGAPGAAAGAPGTSGQAAFRAGR